jgi:phosphatidylglycerol:prolipoprotein diacylglycerol transferase
VLSYTALLNVGLAGGAVIACLAARRCGLGPAHVLDAALAAALGGLVGGRVVYVVAHWAYYGDHLRQALRLWGGGLAWHGGLVGGLVALLIYCTIRRVSLRSVLDVLTPGVALTAVCAWVGCHLSGCAHGIETYPGQGVLWALSLELPDLYGIWMPRVAVQLLGAGWGAVVLAAVAIARRHACLKGLVFPLWLVLYGIGSFWLGFVRADEAVQLAGWQADQVADLALVAIGTVVLAVGLLGKRRGGEGVS